MPACLGVTLQPPLSEASDDLTWRRARCFSTRDHVCSAPRSNDLRKGLLLRCMMLHNCW